MFPAKQTLGKKTNVYHISYASEETEGITWILSFGSLHAPIKQACFCSISQSQRGQPCLQRCPSGDKANNWQNQAQILSVLTRKPMLLMVVTQYLGRVTFSLCQRSCSNKDMTSVGNITTKETWNPQCFSVTRYRKSLIEDYCVELTQR